MKRDEWLAVLREVPWTPCEESSGLPRYRDCAAYYCTFCAYTVCAPCYNVIPTALLFSSNAAPATHAKKVSYGFPCGTLGEKGLSRPRCFFCQKGDLMFEEVPVFEWTCEGPRPARRLQRGVSASYDADIMQRYYMMKEQRDKRALSTAPLVAHFHGAEGPPSRFDFDRVGNTNSDGDAAKGIESGTPGRRFFCEEGSSFFFSVENPRLEVSCMWCAVNRRLVEAHPSLVGDETITPLQMFCCPSSLPGIPPRRFCFHIPYGAYGLFNVHALVLCLEDDIFEKATHNGQAASENKSIQLRPQLDKLGALKEQKCKPFQPLLVVDVLHRVATSDPVRDLLSAQWLPLCTQKVFEEEKPSIAPERPRQTLAFSTTEEDTNTAALPSADGVDSISVGRDGPVAHDYSNNNDNTTSNSKTIDHCDDRNAAPLHGELLDNAFLMWPNNLRCSELLLTLDYLLQGRSVAVYGIASKYFFLQHVSQCAELRHHSVAVVDGYCAAATPITHQLRDIENNISRLEQLAKQELLHSSCVYDAGVRSLGASKRFIFSEHEQGGEQAQHGHPYYHFVTPSHSECSLRSWSYRSPPRTGAKNKKKKEEEEEEEEERESHQSPKSCGNGATDDTPITPFPMQSRFGNTTQQLPSDVAAGCAHVCTASTPQQTKRGDSILLVRGEEEETKEGGGGGGGVLTLGPQELRETHVNGGMRQRSKVGEGRFVTRHDATLGSTLRAWSRRYCLQERSEWNYHVPLVRNKRWEECTREEPRKKRKTGSGENKENKRVDVGGGCEVSASHLLRGRCPHSPRFTFSSSEFMQSLYSACFAPLRACVDWISLPSLTAKRLIPRVQSSGIVTHAPLPRWGVCMSIIVVHGVDQLDVSALFELQRIAREHPYRVLLLCSFDDANWMTSSAAALLSQYRLACVELRSILLPRVREMSAVSSLSLFTDFEAAACGGGRFSRYANGGGAFSTAGALPLYDTIRRILFSLPATFSDLLRCMIARQEASGENVFIPMSLHQEHFYDCGMMISVARLRAVERELTSNRLAVFDAAENKLMIPQHRKLLKVLEEVCEQRRTAEGTAGGTAPVEA